MIGEHLNDPCRFLAATIVGTALRTRHRSPQHHARYRERLAAIVFQQGVDIGHQLTDPGIKLQTVAEPGYQATGKGVTLAWLKLFAETERAYPQVRRARDRVGSLEGMFGLRGDRRVSADFFHAVNLVKNGYHLLSETINLDSIYLNMLYEPTTLASAVFALAETLREDYGIDPEPVFAKVGIPLDPPQSPELRYPLSSIRDLWAEALAVSGDEAIGLKTGFHANPTKFYAFGYSWLASATLLGAMQRLCRYYQLLSTASVEIKLHELDDSYALTADFPEEANSPPKEGIDCGMTALLHLCDIIAEKEIRPLRIDLTCPATVHPEAYRQALRAPITFNCKLGAFYFDKELLQEQLPGASPDIAKATDKIAEQYIETLDPHKIASLVRRLLVSLLPSGSADQDLVANRLNRSTSTLQRQLSSEGLSYREVLESTRRSLAEDYLGEGKHSHAQIAYLLGFSDQSNFSRAFKRWTTMSPRDYQDSLR